MHCALPLPKPPFSSPMATLGNVKSFSSCGDLKPPVPGHKRVVAGGRLYFQLHTRLKLEHAICALATVERETLAPVSSSESQIGADDNFGVSQDGSEEEDSDVDDKEKSRRSKISRANKGNIPWNKGKKHSPETLQRIRERTKIAMQNPKIKMKLLNVGHTHSEETKTKIGDGVKEGWRRRREMKMIQEGCHVDWCNLIAEAAQVGFYGERKLYWNSYELLQEELAREWMTQSVQRRQSMPQVKISNQSANRSPHSLEQKRKIAEAIRAKWADPDYRERVRAGMIKHHGPTSDSEKRQKKRSTRTSSSKVKASVQSGVDESEIKSVIVRKVKKKNTPTYKDPMVTTKLEMIKKVKDQRLARERKKREAAERAKLLIAEAEKAATALEVAAANNPLAEMALKEARYMIAEATQMLDGIDQGPEPTNSSLNDVSLPDSDSSYQDSKLQINGKNMINSEGLMGETINGCHILLEGLLGDGDISRVDKEDEENNRF